jgi:hypothetical protein
MVKILSSAVKNGQNFASGGKNSLIILKNVAEGFLPEKMHEGLKPPSVLRLASSRAYLNIDVALEVVLSVEVDGDGRGSAFDFWIALNAVVYRDGGDADQQGGEHDRLDHGDRAGSRRRRSGH